VKTRYASLDVTRAIALLGVITLNYHGYLNGAEAFRPSNPTIWNRLFSPLTGLLTTRFAATFVLVAGIGVALFVAAANGDDSDTRRRKLVLFRRGALLFGVGTILQWIWPGTILFYYGAYFMIAALIATWKTRTLVVTGLVVTFAAAALAGWRDHRTLGGHSTAWLSPPITSPRNLVIRVFVDYTHPVVPWLVFIIAGIVLGRHLHRLAHFRARLIAISAVALVVIHGARTVWWPTIVIDAGDVIQRVVVSTDPYDRAIGYVGSTLAVALLAFALVSILTERLSDSGIVTVLANVGSLSLTMYLAHVLFYNFLVKQLALVGPDGLATALLLSLLFAVPAFAFAAWWKPRFGVGPAERVYRFFCG